MTFDLFLSLLPMLLGMTGSAAPGETGVRTLVVQEQLILRVPVRPQPRRFEWEEKKGPKCISAHEIRGAFLSDSEHVDLLLSGKRLMRAELRDDCPSLDFYTGFYLNSDDERICAKRDVVRSRVGASCRIQRFRNLVPKVR
ncbi:hypothetical protein H8M03_00240 [Sphingomonas sabuli]|uniref:Uncharacterized protein n=1 Tax=Sphingomonas sabuli TaxID=2764186 RepID=A0A7G9L2J4_9SPHN|nr:hypothetical protein [Sphingomonas sabuli]QNM82843.1 hypothetical protein H8M03_00240 [Sphingomonas sabuli]